MTTVAAPGLAPVAHREVSRAARTISGCCRAILSYFSTDPETCLATADAALRGEFGIAAISRDADHLSMTLLLQMPYGAEHMTISTIGQAHLVLPGLSLSPRVAAAAIGQPIGRLTGHLAFAALDYALVTRVEAGRDGQGRPATILYFDDRAEPLMRVRRGTASSALH